MRRSNARARPGLAGLLALLLWAMLPAADKADKKGGPASSPEAQKALKAALVDLQANRLEPAVEKLKALVRAFASDPAAEKAKALLRENGVADEFRVFLKDREVFRNRFKIPELSVLEVEEKALADLKVHYKQFKPYFVKTDLQLYFYDSQARYRDSGGSVTSGGHYVPTPNNSQRALSGKIEWYFPREATSPRDRQLYLKNTLNHETSHHLSVIYFAGLLPPVLEEGLATFHESRANTEHFQHFRETIRDRYERYARSGLNAIAKFEDFQRLLDSPRGFGQGDLMLERWYGLSYSLLDFLAEGEIAGKKGSLPRVLQKLKDITVGQLGEKEQERIAPLAARAVLSTLVDDFYQVGLEPFHKELLKHVMTRYKKR